MTRIPQGRSVRFPASEDAPVSERTTRRRPATPRLALLFLAAFLGACDDQLLPPAIDGPDGETVYYATAIPRGNGTYNAGSTFTVPSSGTAPATPFHNDMMVCRPRNGRALFLRPDPLQGGLVLCLRNLSDQTQLWEHLIRPEEVFYSADLSEDGRMIVYSFLYLLFPNPEPYIALFDTQGSGQCLKLSVGTVPVDEQGNYQGPTFAPDDSRVAVVAADQYGKCSVLILNMKPPNVSMTALTPGNVSYIVGTAVSWSPGGDSIAFVGQHYSGQRNIYVMEVGPSIQAQDAVPLLDDNSTLTPACPVWSPNGGAIAFVASSRTGQSDIWTVGSTGSGLRRITSTPDISEASVQWSPGGTKLLSLVIPAGIAQIYNANGILEVLNPDGSNVVPIGYDVNRGFWGN